MSTEKQEVRLLDIQIIATIIYLGSLSLSLFITYNDKLSLTNQKKLFTQKQSNILSISNRILVVILTLVFLYVSYKNVDIVKQKNDDLTPSKLQVIGSELSTLSTLIVLYAVLISGGTEYSIVTGIENPSL